MSGRSDDKVREIADAMSGRGRLSHSRLYWWMWDHFVELHGAQPGRADWKSVTRELSRLGFTGRNRAPLKSENVRKTWARVVRDRQRLPQSSKLAPVESTVPARHDAPVKASSSTGRKDFLERMSVGSKLPDPINPKKE